jgi:phosphopantetheine--protein transferase-like protein
VSAITLSGFCRGPPLGRGTETSWSLAADLLQESPRRARLEDPQNALETSKQPRFAAQGRPRLSRRRSKRMLVFHHSTRERLRLGPPYADSGVTFNLSHAGGVALLAFSRSRELGVDVERVRRDLDVDSIARRYFSLHEQRDLATFNSEERYETFFRCWTRKEAYIKAKGEGLSLPLDQFDVSLAKGDTNALISTRHDGSEAARWSLRDVSAGPMWVPSVSLVMSGAYEAGPEMRCAKPLGVSSKSIRRLQTNTTRATSRCRLLVRSDPLCLVNVHSKEASRIGRVARPTRFVPL